MTHASEVAGVAAARAACLIALTIVCAVSLLFAIASANLGALVATAFAAAAILRATVALPRGDASVFFLLWAGLGATLGMGLIAFSVGPVCLMAALLLGLAIATAPNRSGRSRLDVRYVGVQVAALVAAIGLTFAAS